MRKRAISESEGLREERTHLHPRQRVSNRRPKLPSVLLLLSRQGVDSLDDELWRLEALKRKVREDGENGLKGWD